jgi:hypothetical protein
VYVSAPDVRTIEAPVAGTVRISAGYPTRRVAAVSLHGPFPSRPAATCDLGRVAASGSVTVVGDGPYSVPPLRVTDPGVYRWSATVAQNTYNLPATRCGERIVLKAVPRVSVTAVPSRADRGGPARARVATSGLAGGYAADVSVRLYGPFGSRDQVRCSRATQIRRRTAAVTAASPAARTAPVRLPRAGVYAWRAVLPSAMLTTRVVTPCRSGGAFLRVR